MHHAGLEGLTSEPLVQAEGSMLAAWFGPVWAAHQQRDSQGRIFLNCDPYCFGRILSFLRCKLIEDPDQPTLPPVVQSDSQAEFAALVQYLGLKEFMSNNGEFLTTGSGADFHFDQAVHMQLADGGHLAEATQEHGYAMAAPAMLDGEHFIKCKIEKAGPCDWLFLGVTSHPELTRHSQAGDKLRTDIEDHHTSFGWTPFAHYVAGNFVERSRPPSIEGPGRLPQWGAGDELIFRIVLNGLSGSLCMGCLHLACMFELKLPIPFASNIVFAVGAAPGISVHISSASMGDWQRVKDLPRVLCTAPFSG